MQPNPPASSFTDYNASNPQHVEALATLCKLYGISNPVVTRATGSTRWDNGHWIIRGVHEFDGRAQLLATREEGNSYLQATVPLQWQSDEERMRTHGEPTLTLPNGGNGARPDWFPAVEHAKCFALHVKDSPAWQALAPVVRVSWSTLGGPHRVSASLLVVLDERSTWANGILENARHLRFTIERDGTLQQTGALYRSPVDRLRKRIVRHADHLLGVLSEYVAKVNDATEGGES